MPVKSLLETIPVTGGLESCAVRVPASYLRSGACCDNAVPPEVFRLVERALSGRDQRSGVGSVCAGGDPVAHGGEPESLRRSCGSHMKINGFGCHFGAFFAGAREQEDKFLAAIGD